jgi:GntR family transcriptional regulator
MTSIQDASSRLALDSQNAVPLYHQLKILIEQMIKTGLLKPGEKLLSENELCHQFNISRTTVRQALGELVSSGKLIRSQGRGTFVAQAGIQKPENKLVGFSADMRSQGLKPSSRLLDFRPLVPEPHIAAALSLKPKEAAILIHRLRFADDQPISINIVYLPFYRFYRILDEDLEKNSMYDILGKKFDTIPTRSLYTIEAENSNRDLSVTMQIPEGSPVLKLDEITFDQQDRPFEFSTSFFHGGKYSFTVEITKHADKNTLYITNRREPIDMKKT